MQALHLSTRRRTVACCMPILILARTLCGGGDILKAALNKIVDTAGAHSLWATEKRREERAWKHTGAFFHREVYLSAASSEGSQRNLTTEDMFSLCERACDTQGKCYFFTPSCCLWKCQKVSASGCKVKLIKVTIWKEHALIFNQSALWENSKFACVVVEVNFLLWSGNVQSVCNTQHTKADGFLSWICLLLNYIGTLSREVFTLITILLKNAPVIRDSYKMEDGVENKFVS